MTGQQTLKKGWLVKKYIKNGKIVEAVVGKRGTSNKSTIEQIVIGSYIKHNGKYKYLIQKYVDRQTKIQIYCSVCEKPFAQTPGNHLHGIGCPDCGHERRANAQRSNTEKFIEKAKTAQGDTFDDYDYSAADYKGSHIKVEIFCKKCDKPFEQTPGNHLHGNGCPMCVHKTQRKVFKFLIRACGEHNVEYQPKYDWCKGKKPYPFDNAVYKNILVEVDGDQHIDKQISNWASPEEQQERDMYKMTQAINNGKHVIRILQRDAWNDTYDWEKKLLQTIIELKDTTDTTIRCIGDCATYKEYAVETDES